MEKKRQKQVGELIRRGFSTVLFERGSYIYGQALVSVTEVLMSPDLKVAKVYLSIFNTDNKDEVFEMITHHTISLKNDLVKHIRSQVRIIPDIRIYMDDMLDEMDRVNKLLDSIN
ncbi:MAG: ribosome-binding factor A [Deltaproteobacteria bacterium]